MLLSWRSLRGFAGRRSSRRPRRRSCRETHAGCGLLRRRARQGWRRWERATRMGGSSMPLAPRSVVIDASYGRGSMRHGGQRVEDPHSPDQESGGRQWPPRHHLMYIYVERPGEWWHATGCACVEWVWDRTRLSANPAGLRGGIAGTPAGLGRLAAAQAALDAAQRGRGGGLPRTAVPAGGRDRECVLRFRLFMYRAGWKKEHRHRTLRSKEY